MATDFDSLLNRYRNISYGRLGLNNPSSVNNLSSLLDDIQQVEQTEYFRTIPAEEQTFVSGVPQNQWSYGGPTQGDQHPTGLIFGTPDYGLLGGGDAGGAWPTYDPTIDYGDPGYAGVVPGEEGLLGQVIPIQTQAQFGGEGEGRARGEFGMGPIGHENQAAYSMNEDGTFNLTTWDGKNYSYDKDAVVDENGMIEATDEFGDTRKIKQPSKLFTSLAEDARKIKTTFTKYGQIFGLLDPTTDTTKPGFAFPDWGKEELGLTEDAPQEHPSLQTWRDIDATNPGNWGFDENTNSFRQQTMIEGKPSFVGPSYYSPIPDALGLPETTQTAPLVDVRTEPLGKAPGPTSRYGGITGDPPPGAPFGGGQGPGTNGGDPAGTGTGAQGPAGGAVGGGYGNWGGR